MLQREPGGCSATVTNCNALTQCHRFNSGIATIEVGAGNDQKTLSIHEDIIKETSPFFRAALDKKWDTGQTRAIELRDDTSEVVSCYVDWCYSKHIHSSKPVPPTGLKRTDIQAETIFLAKVYVFGEKIQDDAFCDVVITAMAEMADQKFYRESNPNPWFHYADPVTISIIYNGTTADSPARRFLVDVYVSFACKGWFEKGTKYLRTPEFLQDLLVAHLKPESSRRGVGLVRDRRKEWFKQKDV